MGHDDIDPYLTASRVSLVVLGQPAVTPKPTERPFHDPSPRLHLEADRLLPAVDDLQHPAAVGRHPGGERAVDRVGPDHSQSGQRAGRPPEDRLGPVPVLDVSRKDRQTPQQSEGVNQKVPLAAADFFSPRRSPWGRRPRWS